MGPCDAVIVSFFLLAFVTAAEAAPLNTHDAPEAHSTESVEASASSQPSTSCTSLASSAVHGTFEAVGVAGGHPSAKHVSDGEPHVSREGPESSVLIFNTTTSDAAHELSNSTSKARPVIATVDDKDIPFLDRKDVQHISVIFGNISSALTIITLVAAWYHQIQIHRNGHAAAVVVCSCRIQRLPLNAAIQICPQPSAPVWLNSTQSTPLTESSRLLPPPPTRTRVVSDSSPTATKPSTMASTTTPLRRHSIAGSKPDGQVSLPDESPSSSKPDAQTPLPDEPPSSSKPNAHVPVSDETYSGPKSHKRGKRGGRRRNKQAHLSAGLTDSRA